MKWNFMRSILYFVFAILLFTGFEFRAQLPASRVIDWSKAGFTATPPTFTNTVNFLNNGGKINDTTFDNSPPLNSLMASLNGSNTVIYFPKGTYRFKQKVIVPDKGRILLKGAGADSTFFHFSTGNLSFAGNIEVASGYSYASAVFTVVSGYTKGSTTLLLNATSALAAGDWINISQENDTALMNTMNPPGAATVAPRSVGQLMKIVSISSNSVVVDRPLHYTYKGSLDIKVSKLKITEWVGFEDFTIESLYPGDKHHFVLSYAVNCWIKCIRSKKSVSCHINPLKCANLEIKGCFFNESHNYGDGGHGYGVALSAHTTDCLVENNVFDKLRHAMLVQRGANGNVFAYNYSLNSTYGSTLTTRPSDISLHGHFPYMNLFEGNIVEQIHSADYWGPSGNGNTFFRNRVTYSFLKISDKSLEQNVLGNELNNINNNSNSKIINDPGCINTIIHGNNDNGTITWDNSLGSNNLINSYYLSGAPSFFGSSAWPSIGPEYSLGSGTIPAKARYLLGYDTECEKILANIEENSISKNKIVLFPNPVKDKFYLSLPSEMIGIYVYDLTGRKMTFTTDVNGVNVSELSSGIYYCILETKGGKVSLKFVKE